MTHSRVSLLAVLGFFLLALPIALAAPNSDPCKQQQKDFDRWVNDIRHRQSTELQQCAITNGSDSAVCQNLRASGQLDLREARAQRRLRMSGCRNQSAGNNLETNATDVPYTAPACSRYPCDRYADPGPVVETRVHHHHHHKHEPSNTGSSNTSSGSNANYNGSSTNQSSSSGGGSSYTPPAPSYSPPTQSYSPPAQSCSPPSSSGGSGREAGGDVSPARPK